MMPSSYTLVGDNVDKVVNPRFMTSEHQRKSFNVFHSYGVRDRVKCDTTDTSPVGDIASLPPSVFLPDPEDCVQLRKHYAILLSRVLVDHVPYFTKKFKDCVIRHIPHINSSNMCLKSEIVSSISLV